MSALGRTLPPPQARRVQPARTSRFATSYRAPPSSDDDLPPAASLGRKQGSAAAPASTSVGLASPPQPARAERSPVVAPEPVGVAAADASTPGRDAGGDPPASAPPVVPPALSTAAAQAGRERARSDQSSSSLSSPGSRSPSGSSQQPADQPSITPPPPPSTTGAGSNEASSTAAGKGKGKGKAKAKSTTNNVTAKIGSKVYQCSGFGACTMIFTRSEHLARHIRKHTGLKPFTCHCGKAFSRVDNLRQHCATVHPTTANLNESTISNLRQQHTTLTSSATIDLQKYAKTADESLGIVLLFKDRARKAKAPTLGSEDEVDSALQPRRQPSSVAAAGPSSSGAVGKRSTSTEGPAKSQGGASKKKKSRHEHPFGRASASTPSSSLRPAAGGSSNRAQPLQKQLASSRFGPGSRFSPAPAIAPPGHFSFGSPFSSHGLPATPAEDRPAATVKIARNSTGGGSTYGSPYPSYQHPHPLYYDEDPVTRAQPFVHKDLSARARPRPLPPHNQSSGDVQQFTRRHFDELKHAGDDDETARDRSPSSRSARQTIPPGGLLPSPHIFSSRPPAAGLGRMPYPSRTPLPAPPPPPPPPHLPSGTPAHGFQYPTFQAPPARRFTLPHHHAFSPQLHVQGGWPEEPYSTDYSLSSARTRLSSGLSHGPDAGGPAHSRAASAVDGSWPTRANSQSSRGLPRNLDVQEEPSQSAPTPPPRLPGAGSPGAPASATSHRTVHSPEKLPSAHASAPADGRNALMDIAVELSAARRPVQPDAADEERSPSPQGVLWGDPAQDANAHVHQALAGPSFDDHPMRGFGQHRYHPTAHPVLRYESAFSPPNPPPPPPPVLDYWPAHPHDALARQPEREWPQQPLLGAYPHLRTFPVDGPSGPFFPLVDPFTAHGEGPLCLPPAQGPMLSALSPLLTGTGIVDTPPPTTLERNFAASSLQQPTTGKRPRDDDGGGRASLYSKRAALAALGLDDVGEREGGESQESTGGHPHSFHSGFISSLEFERSLAASSVLDSAARPEDDAPVGGDADDGTRHAASATPRLATHQLPDAYDPRSHPHRPRAGPPALSIAIPPASDYFPRSSARAPSQLAYHVDAVGAGPAEAPSA